MGLVEIVEVNNEAAVGAYLESEMGALRRGMILAGYISPRKARILLLALTGLGRSLEENVAEFEARGE